MLALWQRLPTIVRASITGVIVAVAGIIPWSAFVLLNQRYATAIPWAIVPTAAWLWLYWRWLGGAGWPGSTSRARRELRRANPVEPDVLGAAIVVGMIGFGALMPFTILLNRLVTLNQAKPIELPDSMPMLTGFLLLVMASIVAGVVEETAFRGYMQKPIEKRHGVTIAIIIAGLLFGLAHFRHHPGVATLGMLPFYIFAYSPPPSTG
jgi:membrane protease YdiL (CAAX protease family)